MNRIAGRSILVVALLAPCAIVAPAAAQEDARLDLDRLGAGELYWRSEAGPVALASTGVRVDVSVTGVLAHGRVTQSFVNDSGRTVEAVYAFPLPEGAAVHRMEMRIGERRIRSVVRERRS